MPDGHAMIAAAATSGPLWQQVLVALAVFAAALYVLHDRAPGLLRRLRLGLARRLLLAGRRARFVRMLGRWMAPLPLAGGGRTACGTCQKAGCVPRPADHMRNTP
ncbi:MAG: hypothetical protein KatS3mg127_0080 [Silanimonas sp.]|nr:MAG: hypothetical protein KatS3mg127_0080 [Silanimonas sp.]